MLKKLLFISSLILFSINFNYVFAETNLIIPVKKPSLTDEEIKVKISKNILKPLKKPVLSYFFGKMRFPFLDNKLKP